MKNPIQNMRAFSIDTNCPKDQQRKVRRNSNIFFASMIIMIVSIGAMIPTLIIGSETTLIFKNDTNVLGLRVGKILTRAEFPQQKFYVYNKSGAVFDITAQNLSTAYVKTIGFIIIEKAFIDVIKDNPELYTELIGFTMLKLAPMTKFGLAEKLTNLPNLKIYDYIRQYPIVIVVGNFENTITHDVIFKITTDKYFIPLFEIEYVSLPPIRTYYNVGGWVDFSNLDDLKTKRGVWEVSIDTVSYNYATSEYFAKDQLENIGTNDLPPITIEGSIKKSNSFWYMFLPVTRYSTGTSSGIL